MEVDIESAIVITAEGERIDVIEFFVILILLIQTWIVFFLLALVNSLIITLPASEYK